MRRPELDYESLSVIDPSRPEGLSERLREQVNIQVKYAGYIERQKQAVEQFKKLERRKLPVDFDYSRVPGLRIEAREKLQRMQPESVGQAQRIGGVSPADISVLLVWLTKQGVR